MQSRSYCEQRIRYSKETKMVWFWKYFPSVMLAMATISFSFNIKIILLLS